jgi:hypothetical protein
MSEASVARTIGYHAARGRDPRSRDDGAHRIGIWISWAERLGKDDDAAPAARLLPADDGTIDLLGTRRAAGVHKALAKIEYVPERPHLYPQFTVEETIRYHAAFYPDGTVPAPNRSAASLRCVPSGRWSASRGRRQADDAGGAPQSQFAVLDEPTDGLDPVVRRDVLASCSNTSRRGRDGALSATSSTSRSASAIRGRDGRRTPDRGNADGDVPAASSGCAWWAPVDRGSLPFTLLSRGVTAGREEEWVVRGWQPAMREYFAAAESELREVIDLDLEESFVELLRAARQPAGVAGEAT